MFENLKNKTIIKVTGLQKYSDEIIMWTSDGYRYNMFHEQDCCESVSVEDIDGDVEDILNSPILLAEEVSNSSRNDEDYESATWTFYKLATIKGYMTIRWLGTSNGYYSESVTVTEEKDLEETRDVKIEMITK